jgi:two-component system response regulator FixJ
LSHPSSNRRDQRLLCIVDDNVSLLASYGALLESAGFMVIPYSSGSMLLADDKYLRAGCVLLDLNMPAPDGLETLKKLRSHPEAAPVIMITGEGDIPKAVQAIKLGAYDFVEKPINDDVLIALIEKVTQQALSDLTYNRQQETTSHLDTLTQRENEVLHFLMTGSTNKEIAIKLGISHRTVEVHRASIMSKTGAKSLSSLVMMAMNRSDHASP